MTIEKESKMFKGLLLFFFFSCCFAQPVEKICYQDDNNVPRAGDELKASSSQDGNELNEILNQLTDVLIYDLRQTSIIMAKMGNMKLAEEMKDKLAEKRTGKIDDESTRNEEEMGDMGMEEKIGNMKEEIWDMKAKIHSLGIRGKWCSHKNGAWTTGGTITYDLLTYADSNMEITCKPMDIRTGN